MSYYYQAWSNQNWQELSNLYSDGVVAIYGDKTSKMTGIQQIAEKMNSFGQMAFDTANMTLDVLDYQGQFYLVQIVGKMQIQGQDNALNFSQTWNLLIVDEKPQILLDIFKPVY